MNELDFLLHTLGQIVGSLVTPRAEAKSLEPDTSLLAALRPFHTADLSEEGQQLDDPHLLVDAALLRQVPDLFPTSLIWIFTKQAYRALIWVQDSHDHAKAGRLTGSVRPK